MKGVTTKSSPPNNSFNQTANMTFYEGYSGSGNPEHDRIEDDWNADDEPEETEQDRDDE